MQDLNAADILGIIGSLMLCWAYFMVSRARIDPEGMRFHLLNVGGSVLLLISLYYRPNPGAILIEVLWLAIALSSIARWLRKRG